MAATIQVGTVSVTVDAQGGVVIDTGNASYRVDTYYSYPGGNLVSQPPTVNQLPKTASGSETGWNPQITQSGPTTIEVAAAGNSYWLIRTLQILQDGVIQFEDQLTNLRNKPTGIVVHYAVIAPQSFAADSVIPGGVENGAENPTLFLDAGKDVLGILVQDDFSRLRWHGGINGTNSAEADFQIGPDGGCIAVDRGKSYTIRWRLYLLGKGADYFHFVNRVRQDWKTNFTVAGSLAFLEFVIDSKGSIAYFNASNGAPITNLPAYLRRKRLGLVGLGGYLDQQLGWTRDQFKTYMTAAVSLLKAAAPEIKCLGKVETDWVAINPDLMLESTGFFSSNYWTSTGYPHLLQSVIGRLPAGTNPNEWEMTLIQAETAMIDQAYLPWNDSVWRDQNGNLAISYYYGVTMLRVYPAGCGGYGNYQYKFLLENEIKFLLDSKTGVGLDGVYIDDFNQSTKDSLPYSYFRTYTGWDGMSADIDPSTGEIAPNGFYIDMGLAGRAARKEICEYLLSNKKTVVANTYATSEGEQALPINRFAETWSEFSTGTVLDSYVSSTTSDGTEPPLDAIILRGNLASPVGLGVAQPAGSPVPYMGSAHRLNKAVITYLRHGLVYYHYQIGDIPPGQGEYGPVNQMFPITPIAFYKGWIEGKERTITAIPGTYRFPPTIVPFPPLYFPPPPLPPFLGPPPQVHCFDINGIEIVPPPVQVSAVGLFELGKERVVGWVVEVNITPWAETAVIEWPTE